MHAVCLCEMIPEERREMPLPALSGILRLKTAVFNPSRIPDKSNVPELGVSCRTKEAAS